MLGSKLIHPISFSIKIWLHKAVQCTSIDDMRKHYPKDLKAVGALMVMAIAELVDFNVQATSTPTLTTKLSTTSSTSTSTATQFTITESVEELVEWKQRIFSKFPSHKSTATKLINLISFCLNHNDYCEKCIAHDCMSYAADMLKQLLVESKQQEYDNAISYLLHYDPSLIYFWKSSFPHCIEVPYDQFISNFLASFDVQYAIKPLYQDSNFLFMPLEEQKELLYNRLSSAVLSRFPLKELANKTFGLVSLFTFSCVTMYIGTINHSFLSRLKEISELKFVAWNHSREHCQKMLISTNGSGFLVRISQRTFLPVLTTISRNRIHHIRILHANRTIDKDGTALFDWHFRMSSNRPLLTYNSCSFVDFLCNMARFLARNFNMRAAPVNL